MAVQIDRLLKVVWGDRKGFVFLPHKDATDPEYPKRGWHETKGIPYNGQPPNLQQLPEMADLYWCPVVFKEARRRKEYALPTNILWADLDPIHPDACKVKPSIAWESSPGRYHALWILDEEIPADEAAQLSKRIAYGDGGDKGGWDLTQVLRIPGTLNFKYPSHPQVRLLWAKNLKYSVSLIKSSYKPVNGSASTTTAHTTIETGVSASGPQEAKIQWIDLPEATIGPAVMSLPLGMRKRLFASPDGDRSLQLQKLARDMTRFGLSPHVTLHILQRSTWNKFRGRSDEQQQLLRQVESARDYLRNKSTPSSVKAGDTTNTSASTPPTDELIVPEMKTWTWNEFMSIPTTLKWLIQDSWVDQTVGFISGRSKSYKTWIALDLALSLLSGEPFLGKFPVGRTGPVLLIQEEDPAAILQERLRLIAKQKNMLPSIQFLGGTRLRLKYPDYPIRIENIGGFSLTDNQRLGQVRRWIADDQPVAVILDPLIVMLGEDTDTNNAVRMAHILQEVKMWREDFKTNVVVVHHWNKLKTEEGDRGGAHMYGSFALHAWLESALHLEPLIDPESSAIDTVLMEREFKAAAGSRQLKLQFKIDSIREFIYEVNHLGETIGTLAQKLIDIMGERASWMTTGELVDLSGYSRSKVIEELHKLRRLSKLEVEVGGGRGKSSKYKLKQETEDKG